MRKYHELGLLKDLGYCKFQSSDEDFLVTRKISELGMILNDELEEKASLARESTFSL